MAANNTNVFRTAIVGGIGMALSMTIINHLKDIISSTMTSFKHRFIGNMTIVDYYSIEISKETTPKLFDNIIADLEEKSNDSVEMFSESSEGLVSTKRIVPGYYYISYQNVCINFEVTDDSIITWIYYESCRNPDEFLRRYLNNVFIPPIVPERPRRIHHYLQNGSSWRYPEIRRSYIIERLTANQIEFMNYINRFIASTRRVKAGCLIHGPPGTGKSAIIQHMATLLNRRVYHINLNDTNMTDVVFASLIAGVEAEGIIIIDEFEKQYANLSNNPNNLLSDGAILNALDGSVPIAHKVIIILISNTNISTTLPDTIRSALFRSGRIGKIFEFTQVINIDDDSDIEN